MNSSLIKAWSVFLVIVVLFVTSVEIYHKQHRDANTAFRCRILVNKDLIIDESENKNKVEEKSKHDGIEDPLYEKTKYGLLPRVPMSGEKVFDKFSAKTVATKIVKVAVAINKEKIEDIVKLISRLGESKVTFIVPNYIEDFSNIVSLILEHGHEIFLLIPTQQLVDDTQKVSPFLANSKPEETLDKLLKLIASTTKIIGVANISSTLLTKSVPDMNVVTLELAKRGLAFFDINVKNDVLKDLAKKTGLIYLHSTEMYIANKTNTLKEDATYFVEFSDVDGFLKILPDNMSVAPISQDETK